MRGNSLILRWPKVGAKRESEVYEVKYEENVQRDLRIELTKNLFLNDSFKFPVLRSAFFGVGIRFPNVTSYESSGHKKRSVVRPARFIDFHDWSLSLLFWSLQQINIHPRFPVLLLPASTLSFRLVPMGTCSICVYNLHARFYSAEHGSNLSSVWRGRVKRRN